MPLSEHKLGTRLWRYATGVALTLILAALGMTLWLDTHPERILAAVNTRLPAGIGIIEASGLSASPVGGRFKRLQFDFEGITVTIEDAHWLWGLLAIRPLRLAPVSFMVGRLEVRLAAGSDAPRDAAPLLPRFWTLPWWPAVADAGVTISAFRLLGHDGNPLSSGQIEITNGGSTGKARLDLPQDSTVDLRWLPLSGARNAWQLAWDIEARNHAHGTLELHRHDTSDDIDWSLKGTLTNLSDTPLLQALELDAHGRADVFASMHPLLHGRLKLLARLQTPLGSAPTHCSASLSLAQSLAAALVLDACDMHVDAAEIMLRSPLLITFDAGWSLSSVGTTGGSLKLARLPVSGWTIHDLQIEARAATLWQAGSSSIDMPATTLQFGLGLPADEAEMQFIGETGATRFEWTHPQVALHGLVHAAYGRLRLQQPLELQTTLSGSGREVAADGTLRHPAIGRLLGWRIAHARDHDTLQGELGFDSRDWHWDRGLLTSLLGEQSAHSTADLRSGELRANARIDGTMRQPRLHLEAFVNDAAGTLGNLAFAGLACTPIRLMWTDVGLALPHDITCSARNVHAGITLDALRATLHQSDAGLQLHGVTAELLGGKVMVGELDVSAGIPARADISIRGIDLARVASLLDEPALELVGRIDGELPLKLQDGTPMLEQGTVSNAGPGVIRYHPAAAPARESAELALTRKALSNLEFDSLQATLDYHPDGTLAILAAIRGRNPALDAGRPVHLNLTLETNLRTLMQGLRAGDRVDTWLERRLQAR